MDTDKHGKRLKNEGVSDWASRCECTTWAREPHHFFTEHHPRCPNGDSEAEKDNMIVSLVEAIERWAMDEDGVHPDAWEAYQRACWMMGKTCRIELDPDEH